MKKFFTLFVMAFMAMAMNAATKTYTWDKSLVTDKTSADTTIIADGLSLEVTNNGTSTDDYVNPNGAFLHWNGASKSNIRYAKFTAPNAGKVTVTYIANSKDVTNRAVAFGSSVILCAKGSTNIDSLKNVAGVYNAGWTNGNNEVSISADVVAGDVYVYNAIGGCSISSIVYECEEATKKLTIDDICGNYSSAYSCGSSTYENGTMYPGYKGTGITITKFDTDSVKITKLSGGSLTAKGKFDYDAQTITLAGKFYLFDDAATVVPSTVDETKPAVAKINTDGTIAVNYLYVYGGTYGNYGYRETLTKSTQTLLWSVEGNADYLNSDGSTKWGTHSYKGTLKKYEGGDFTYEVTYGDPSYGYANPETIQFNVNTDGTLSIVNGTASGSYIYFYYPSSDIYDVSFYNNGYSAFDKGPSETEGECYFWYNAYGYENNYAQINSGYFNFSWPYVAPSAINNVDADANANAGKVIKTADYIIKDGKKYNYAGQQMK